MTRHPVRDLIGAVIVVAVVFASALFADPAEARMISGPDHRVTTVRVVHVEPDNGRRLMWSLNNGADYVTARPRACRRENRPRLCRAAYRQAIRTYGYWWRQS